MRIHESASLAKGRLCFDWLHLSLPKEYQEIISSKGWMDDMEGDNNWQLQCVNKMALFFTLLYSFGTAGCQHPASWFNVKVMSLNCHHCCLFFHYAEKRNRQHIKMAFPHWSALTFKKNDAHISMTLIMPVKTISVYSSVCCFPKCNPVMHLVHGIVWAYQSRSKILWFLILSIRYWTFLEIRMRFKWFSPRILTLFQPLMSSFI